MAAIERHSVFVANAAAAKNIQRRTDGEMNPAFADSGYVLKVVEGLCAAGVGSRNRRPMRQAFDEVQIDSAAETLHVDSVNEKLGAMFGQLIKSFGRQDNVGE